MGGETTVRRDVAIILIGGAVLGLLYNGVGLATRPPRGIAWIAQKEVLPTLESLAGPDSASAVPGVEVLSPERGSVASSAPPSAKPTRTTGTGAMQPAPGAGRTPGPAATGAAPPPAAAMPDPRRVAPLPFIPESGQPIQVELPTVLRFFEAHAALFLDARDATEYQAGHIPGALRLTNADAQGEPERVKTLPAEGRPIIAYCEGGACEASLDLARTLIEAGYHRVLVYMGGYPEWASAGHPVEKGSGGR